MNIEELELMTASEAGQRWGYARNHVPLTIRKNSEKAKSIKGLYCYVGSKSKQTMLITREGMEKLTGMTEEQARKRKKPK